MRIKNIKNRNIKNRNMKREIKFRGLRVDGKGWAVGYIQPTTTTGIFEILHLNDNHDWTRYKVLPETIGQFTGLKDKKGIDIYEGDVVQDIVVGLKSEIVFTTYANFGLRPLNNEVKYLEFETIDDSFALTTIEVIGNIHEK